MSLIVDLLGVRGDIPTPPRTQEVSDVLLENLMLYERSNYYAKMDATGFHASLPEYSRSGFGGNTTSFQLTSTNDSSFIILDAGTGIKNSLYQLMKGPCAIGKGEVNILLSGFQYDQLMGLFLFTPLYIEGNKINIYSSEPNAEKHLRALFAKPLASRDFAEIEKQIKFHFLTPNQNHNVNGFQVYIYAIGDGSSSWGFKIEKDSKTVCYCAKGTSKKIIDLFNNNSTFFKNADLLIYDAQSTNDEAESHKFNAHSSAIVGLKLALDFEIKRIVFVSHGPFDTDNHITYKSHKTYTDYEKLVLQYHSQKKTNWMVGYEGLNINLD